MNNKYRNHMCGELNIKNVSEEVKLAGWVQRIRNLGAMKFVDLRDETGITQIVINDEKLLEGIDLVTECVISVDGTVLERSNKNLKIPTGEIEVEAKNITMLGKCKNVLPFEVNSEKVDRNQVKEDLRLQYRFLDLRDDKLHKNILLRSKILKFLRDKMDEMGFAEIQTPILANSSPEGARDFLVPSRLHPGEFYALPQAPQQFKQLLMVSGFNKYFQLAPCFRDEDPRADRAPGEFYQLDFEMSFGTQEEVFEVLEEIFTSTFKKFTTWKVDEGPQGGIAKFVTDEVKKGLEEKLGAKTGDSLFFVADEKLEIVQKIAGLVRIELGKRLDLLEKDTYRFCFIVDFPMYEYNEEEGKIDFNHNPFSMPQGGMEALNTMDPLDVVAYQYDVVCNGYEMASGAVRNHDPELMVKAFEIAGYSEQEVETRFGALYNAFKYGTPPHAGAAPGVDRMIMLIANEDNLREIIAFPKNKKARDVLMGAPSNVTEEQLRDVHIKLIEE